MIAFDLPITASFVCPDHGPYDSAAPAGVQHYCPDCTRAFDRKREAAAAIFAVKCTRYRLWLDSGVPARYRNRTLDSWQPRSEAQRGVLSVVSRWADDLPARVRLGMGLLFLGPPGVGKTHLQCACVSAACVAGIAASYAVWPVVVERHKQTFGKKDHADRELLGHLATVPLLALDELDAGSDFDRGLLFDLIDRRYQEQRPTLIASNLMPATLNRIGERTADRLRECAAPVPIIGSSRRAEVADDDVALLAPAAMSEPTLPTVRGRVTIDGKRRYIERTVQRVHGGGDL